MRYVSATEFSRNFAQIQHEVHQEVIAVTSDGRTAGYFVSPEHYAEFAGLRAKARENLRIGDLPDDVVEALRNTKMDARHDELNKLMDD